MLLATSVSRPPAAGIGPPVATIDPPSPVPAGASQPNAREPAGTLSAGLTGEEAAARLRAFVSSDVIGVIEGCENEITGANDAFLTMLGYTREDLEAGRLLWPELTPPGWGGGPGPFGGTRLVLPNPLPPR